MNGFINWCTVIGGFCFGVTLFLFFLLTLGHYSFKYLAWLGE